MPGGAQTSLLKKGLDFPKKLKICFLDLRTLDVIAITPSFRPPQSKYEFLILKVRIWGRISLTLDLNGNNFIFPNLRSFLTQN